MGKTGFIHDDLVKVKRDSNGKTVVLFWGDPVEVIKRGKGSTQIKVLDRDKEPFTATAKKKLKIQADGVLRLSMVDVQQGDGLVLETPKGRVLFIDGGDNKLFARHAAARYRHTGNSESDPLPVEAMIVTHGDADHFKGLSEIVKSEAEKGKRAHKRLFLHPKRIYHNGLVKGPGKDKNGKTVPGEKIFGKTVVAGSETLVVDLEDDLRTVDSGRMNTPFRQWMKSVKHWEKRGPIEIRRVAAGDGAAFKFLQSEGIEVEVFGPITTTVKHKGKKVSALPLLHQPPKNVEFPDGKKAKKKQGHGAHSASHTINGHSIVFRLQLGNVRFLLTGDLNEESMKILRQTVGDEKLEAEIVKVPHHGSADFDPEALAKMAGVVWLISSGDESSHKEYIHPRATLMGALGRASRPGLERPIVFCTELAAFFAYQGPSQLLAKKKKGRSYEGFERTTFGIVHVRTDGERVLVFTHSGKETLKEAYRFSVNKQHRIRFQNVITR